MKKIPLSVLTATIASQDGRDDDSTAFLLRQLRNCLNMGLLLPADYQGYGKTAAALFDEAGLCAARLFTVLIDLGFDVKLLRKVRDIMQRDLLKIIDETRQNQNWSLVLTLKRETSTGEAKLIGGFFLTDEIKDKKTEKIVAAQDKKNGVNIQAKLTIPASDLFQPLLDAE